ncbi:MAG: ACT domain-containing protein [Patescibacteria group bacterium]
MKKELFVSALTTEPKPAIPIEFLLRQQSIDGGVTRIEAVLDKNNLNAKTLARLAALAFGIGIKPKEISVLKYVPDKRDEFFAGKFGFKILPIAHAALKGGKVEAWIGPAFVPSKHPLTQNGNKRSVLLSSEKSEGKKPKIGVRLNSEIVSSYYVRFAVKDNPGVLAQIAQKLGDQGISISEMLQPEAEEGSDQTEIAFLLHPCETQNLNLAVQSISNLEVVIKKANLPLRVLQ